MEMPSAPASPRSSQSTAPSLSHTAAPYGTVGRAALLPVLSRRSLAIYYAVVAPIIAAGVALMMIGGPSYSVGTWVITGLASGLGLFYSASFLRTDRRLARRRIRRPKPTMDLIPPHWTLYVDRDGVLRENSNRARPVK